VKGHDLVLLQALFATMATELDAHTDLVAERLVVLGGVARGTVRTAATHSRLPEYPGAIMDGDAHVRVLTECFASYATALRADIAHATEVEEAGSAALYTDISRGVDTRLGFLEAYLHHDGVSTEPTRHNGRRAQGTQWSVATAVRMHGAGYVWSSDDSWRPPPLTQRRELGPGSPRRQATGGKRRGADGIHLRRPHEGDEGSFAWEPVARLRSRRTRADSSTCTLLMSSRP